MASQVGESRGRAALVTRLLERATDGVNAILARADDCHPQENVDLCQKPRISSQTITGIVVGVVLGLLLIGSLCIALFFHTKKRKAEKQEDVEDQFQMSDYGLDDGPASRHKKPQGPQRLSFDDLPQPGHAPNRNAQPNPFTDDAVSIRSVERRNSNPPSQPRPKPESSQNLPADNK